MCGKSSLADAPLGKKVTYDSKYDPSLLFPISRKEQREEIGASFNPPFHGIDLWNMYELSWLNQKGKPVIALCDFRLPFDTPWLIESKSLKLYFNSFNQTKFPNEQTVLETIEKDLSQASGGKVKVQFSPLQNVDGIKLEEFHGVCLDQLDVVIEDYNVNPKLLKCGTEIVEENVYSNLLKSNCLATEQPDWGSVFIHYVGPKIEPESLLKYIVSFRLHNEFHEHCIERIFMDLFRECKTKKLTVFGKYTRRGGLDINPFRSNFEEPPQIFSRTPRQ